MPASLKKKTKKPAKQKTYLRTEELWWWAKLHWACSNALDLIKTNLAERPETIWNALTPSDRRWAARKVAVFSNNLTRNSPADDVEEFFSENPSWYGFRRRYLHGPHGRKGLVRQFSRRMKELQER